MLSVVWNCNFISRYIRVRIPETVYLLSHNEILKLFLLRSFLFRTIKYFVIIWLFLGGWLSNSLDPFLALNFIWREHCLWEDQYFDFIYNFLAFSFKRTFICGVSRLFAGWTWMLLLIICVPKDSSVGRPRTFVFFGTIFFVKRSLLVGPLSILIVRSLFSGVFLFAVRTPKCTLLVSFFHPTHQFFTAVAKRVPFPWSILCSMDCWEDILGG